MCSLWGTLQHNKMNRQTIGTDELLSGVLRSVSQAQIHIDNLCIQDLQSIWTNLWDQAGVGIRSGKVRPYGWHRLAMVAISAIGAVKTRFSWTPALLPPVCRVYCCPGCPAAGGPSITCNQYCWLENQVKSLCILFLSALSYQRQQQHV